MSKEQIATISNSLSLTLPFFMITSLFVGLAYMYGDSFTPFYMGECIEMVKLTHIPIAHL